MRRRLNAIWLTIFSRKVVVIVEKKKANNIQLISCFPKKIKEDALSLHDILIYAEMAVSKYLREKRRNQN